jgi:hypothetical protein
MKIPLSIILLLFTASIANASDASWWKGNWSHTECWDNLSGSNDCVVYEVKIKPPKAHISINGYMTYEEIDARTEKSECGISIIFESKIEGFPKSDRDLPGTKLMELCKSNNAAKVKWGAIQPNIAGSENATFQKN